MSTRATMTIADEHDSFDIYQHHDGYPDGPHGLVRYIAMAQRLAWDLPRFEAADFAAAIIAVLKDRGGSTYLTKDAEAHSDRAFHYRIEPLREHYATRVMVTITRPSYERAQGDVEVFTGDVQETVRRFAATAETSEDPREWQILREIEVALNRAEEKIGQWIKGTPDLDTQSVLNDVDNAGRAACRLRHHLEKTDPWAVLARVQTQFSKLSHDPSNSPGAIARTEVQLAMETHLRFQRA